MAGFSKIKAIVITILVELTTTLGAFLGLFVTQRFHGDNVVGIVLAHVAGGFLYIVLFALIQEMKMHEKKSILAYAMTGFLSIVGLSAILEPIIGKGH